MIRPSYAHIHIPRLISNFKKIHQINKHNFFCPMIKANAYGHGDIIIARHLSNLEITAFGVGLIEEAIRLREFNISNSIIFFGTFNKESITELEQYKITPVISSFEQLELLKFFKNPQKIHIKIDTGMHRFGFLPQEIDPLIYKLSQITDKIIIEGIMTHLACGEDFMSENSFSNIQLKTFELIMTKMEKQFGKLITHVFNSHGLVSYDLKYSQLVKKHGSRIGIGLYGYLPDIANNLDLEPVMELWSKIIHIIEINQGESVSYGRTWVAKKKSWIAVIPLGYADGIPRFLSNNGFVYIMGQKVPIIGNVTMDNLMCDVTDLIPKYSKEYLLGQDVMLIGKTKETALTALDWASWGKTIVWEILTRISERVPRIIIDKTI